MRRHWYKVRSTGEYFRNCPLILDEMKAPWNYLPRRQRLLREEYDQVWKEGVHRVSTIGPHDTWSDWDDSPEATEAWVTDFMHSQGYPDYPKSPYRAAILPQTASEE